jgi:hypothetical protein
MFSSEVRIEVIFDATYNASSQTIANKETSLLVYLRNGNLQVFSHKNLPLWGYD